MFRSFKTWRMAELCADLICLCVFVLLGRQSHDLSGGVSWFATVAWPFVVAWLLSTGIWARSTNRVRPLATFVTAFPLAMVLRVTITHRAAPTSFIIVAVIFNGLLMIAWRAAWRVGSRRLATRS